MELYNFKCAKVKIIVQFSDFSAMYSLWRSIKESTQIALAELAANKLRSFLSLLGITIGIFCIVSIYTAVESLERSVFVSFSKFSDNTIYVSKVDWSNQDASVDWLKMLARPNITLNDYRYLRENMSTAKAVSTEVEKEVGSIRNGDLYVENIELSGVDGGYEIANDISTKYGRYFNSTELASGYAVCMLGYNIYKELFPEGFDPTNRIIKAGPYSLRVIGVAEESTDLFGNGMNNNVLVPFNYMSTLVNLNDYNYDITIIGDPRESLETVKGEIISLLRNKRSLSPRMDNNFGVNVLDFMKSFITETFAQINVFGGGIGIFSILVGGFGIANIMFVSVKERTNLIGIKKALGAKNYLILTEFLVESIVLCLIGGLIGMIFVFVATQLANNFIEEEGISFMLSVPTIVKGIGFSVLIGIVSGFAPALTASRLDPIEAIRR